MDLSFATQALAVEHLVRSGEELGPGRPPVPGRAGPRGRAPEARRARRPHRRAHARPGGLRARLGPRAARGRRRADGTAAARGSTRRPVPVDADPSHRDRLRAERRRAGDRRRVRRTARRRCRAARRRVRAATARRDGGLLPESEIEPVAELPDADALPDAGEEVAGLLDRTVVLKLNGGLGTSMGMTRAKSLLEVRTASSFLDIIARQVLDLRGAIRRPAPAAGPHEQLPHAARTRSPRSRRTARSARTCRPTSCRAGCRSSSTTARSRPRAGRPIPSSSGRRPGTATSIPRSPAPACSSGCWSGGYRWAFVSNADNLGATLDPRILAWIAREERAVPHGGRRPHRGRPQGRAPRAAGATGRASCCARSRRRRRRTSSAFQDITRHRFFNTNTIWLDLRDGRRGPRGRRRHRPADDHQPQDGRPRRRGLAEGHPAGDRDGRGDRELPRGPRAARPALALPAGEDDGRPARRCAPTPTCSTSARTSWRRPPAARRPRRSSGSTPTGTGSSTSSTRASRRGRRRSWRCDALTVAGDVRFGRDVVVRGTVTVEQDGDAPRVVPDGALLEG